MSEPTGVLLRVRSHRAGDRLRRLCDVVEWFSWTEGHYTEVPPEHVDAALTIKGIGRARKPRTTIMKCWSAKETGERMSNMNYDPDDEVREREARQGYTATVDILKAENERLATELRVANEHVAMVEAINVEVRTALAERAEEMAHLMRKAEGLHGAMVAAAAERINLLREVERGKDRIAVLNDDLAQARDERDRAQERATAYARRVGELDARMRRAGLASDEDDR